MENLRNAKTRVALQNSFEYKRNNHFSHSPERGFNIKGHKFRGNQVKVYFEYRSKNAIESFNTKTVLRKSQALFREHQERKVTPRGSKPYFQAFRVLICANQADIMLTRFLPRKSNCFFQLFACYS